MFVARLGRRFGNELYTSVFPIYRPLYSAFKAYADRAEAVFWRATYPPDASLWMPVQTLESTHNFSRGASDPMEWSIVSNHRRLTSDYDRAVSKLPNVRANQLAVSDRTQESLLYISDDLNVDHRVYPTEGEARKTLTIHSTKLDDYFKPGERVDFLKMDIQGYELHALQRFPEIER